LYRVFELLKMLCNFGIAEHLPLLIFKEAFL
jgi:hypothetical protein